jgi:hypothetical protein
MTAGRFWVAIGILLSLMAVLQITSIVQESQTFDEAMHLAAGYFYWRTGDFTWNLDHPPLAKLLCALPLLVLTPGLPTDHPEWPNKDLIPLSRAFVYQNTVPPDTMLFWARLITILLTLALGISIAFWAKIWFGPAAALAAVFLFATDPNLIAHGRYVTTDVPVSLFFFLSCALWGRFLHSRRGVDLALTGVNCGLAMATKYQAIFLIVFHAVFYLTYWLICRRGSAVEFIRSMAVLAGLGALVIAAVYGPATSSCFASGSLAQMVNDPNHEAPLTMWLAENLRLPAHPFLAGLHSLEWHNVMGHPAYLLGRVSSTGWWYYFPVAFAMKTTVAVLLLSGGASAMALMRVKQIRQRPLLPWLIFAMPAGLYFLMSMFSRINLGLRHLLPVYPLLYVLLGAAAASLLTRRRGWAMAVMIGAAAVQIAEVARIHPHYLAFFNAFAGGPENGPRYLVDSNIDWGQDLKKLGKFVRSAGGGNVCLLYFGQASPPHYGVGEWLLPRTDQPEERKAMDCLAAISVTPLHDVYVPPGAYAWLRPLTPIAKVGYSIYVYDMRKR